MCTFAKLIVLKKSTTHVSVIVIFLNLNLFFVSCAPTELFGQCAAWVRLLLCEGLSRRAVRNSRDKAAQPDRVKVGARARPGCPGCPRASPIGPTVSAVRVPPANSTTARLVSRTWYTIQITGRTVRTQTVHETGRPAVPAGTFFSPGYFRPPLRHTNSRPA